MADGSILELAADVREQLARLADLETELRNAGGEWTGLSLARSTLYDGLHSALVNAGTMSQRIERMGRDELKRAKAAKEPTP